MGRRLQKVVSAGHKSHVRTYIEYILAGGKHWGCKDVQGLTAVW